MGILKGINSAQLVADLFLFHYESSCLSVQNLTPMLLRHLIQFLDI